MSQSTERPLLTFALVSCNQEQFVREAVEAAFAQTYSPLQIILSDDFSDDRSFDIMCEMAAAYRGPHQVELNRNPVRRKTGGHFNRVAEMSRGELIVIAAADDVSLPNRTRIVYDAWEQTGRHATSIYSDVIQIDEDGQVIEQVYKGEKPGEQGELVQLSVEPLAYVQTLKPTVHGCTHVISPSLFRIFGDMPEAVIYEDKVLGFRTVLAGKLLYINEKLVKYRLHGANIHKYVSGGRNVVNLKSLEEREKRLQREFRNNETMYQAFLCDLEKAGQHKLVDKDNLERMVQEAERLRQRCSLMNEFLRSGFFRKCRILFRLREMGLNALDRKILVRHLPPAFIRIGIGLARNYAASLRDSSGRRANDRNDPGRSGGLESDRAKS